MGEPAALGRVGSSARPGVIRRAIYVLPKPDFFARGRRGRVSHACGVVSGLRALGIEVIVISGPGTSEVFAGQPGVLVREINHQGPGLVAARRWVGRLLVAVDQELAAHADIDAVIVRYAVSNRGLFTPLLRRYATRVWCIEVNSLAYHQYRGIPAFARRFLRRYETRVLAPAQVIYVVSAPLRDDICAARPQLRGRIAVVPNGGPNLGQPQLELPARGLASEGALPRVEFTYLGVFQPYYEFDLVVAAFRELRRREIDAALSFYGYGPGYDSLKESCRLDGDISFHGRYDLGELARTGAIKESAVLLLPNRPAGMSEIGSPIKLYEYMTLGRPIIAADVGQASVTLQHGRTALLYRAGDLASCVDAMATLARDPDLRAQLAHAAWEEFSRHHTWEARMRDLCDAIVRAVRRDGGS